MPIYEYQCKKCGHEFEREQRIVEDPIKRCPACRSNQAQRLISKTSFVLKGGGWYNDLYSSAKPSDKSDDAKGDSKTDAKAESKSDASSSSETTKAGGESKKSDSKSKGKGSKAKKSAA